MTHTQPTPVDSAFAPLRVTRNTAEFQSWWLAVTDTTDITDSIDALGEPRTSDVESSLHWLMVSVFQRPVPVTWLEVHGLHPTAQVSRVVLDANIAHDNDGDVIGVDVVLSLHVRTADGTVVATTPSVYVPSPATLFAPTSTLPGYALAEIIDTALDLVNATIAAVDRFATLARAPREQQRISSHGDTFNTGDLVKWDDTQTTHTGRIKRWEGEDVAVINGCPYSVHNVHIDSLHR